MENNSNIVTCEYCKFFKAIEPESNIDFFEVSKGKCEKHDKVYYVTDKICSSFIIKNGLYTTKEYPGKENRKPTPFSFYYK